MDSKTYQAEFGRSRAPVFFPENVSPVYVGMLMASRQKTAELIDAVKRALFYNNTDKLKKLGAAVVAENDLNLPYLTDIDQLHAILGMEGEVGEISEAVLSDDDQDQVRARIVDESGDTLWYMALLFDKHGITFDEVFAGNIEKLKKRYPDKFTTDLAVNRDTAAEAEVFGRTVH